MYDSRYYYFISAACLHYLYIFAFTSGKANAESYEPHRVEVKTTEQTKYIQLPNTPGENYKENKGDLWKLEFDRDLGFTECVNLKGIQQVAIKAGSKDGWNIDSIVTYVGFVTRKEYFRQLTQDINAFKWVDDKKSHVRFVLTKV